MSEEVRKLFPGNMKYIEAFPIANYIEQLQQENKILKENAENNDKVVDKLNWDNKLLKQENQQLKEQLDISETNYEIIYGYFTQIGELLDEETCEGMLEKINNLKNQLKQRDEVIDEAISTIESWNFALTWAENDRLKIIVEILQKYKGDNK